MAFLVTRYYDDGKVLAKIWDEELKEKPENCDQWFDPIGHNDNLDWMPEGLLDEIASANDWIDITEYV